MRQYRLYILDLDGTLFRGERALPHAIDVVAELRRRGALVRFLTNNSGRTREFYADKLQRLGFAVAPGEIYSSGIGAATWLVDQHISTVYVVGESGLAETLLASGVVVVNYSEGQLGDGLALQSEAVVAGICRGLTYEWINSAMQQILAGARFVATNPDNTYPVEDGFVPGAGAIVAAIRECSGVQPIVVGKPNPYLIDLILREAGVAPCDALVVGDRVDTDMDSGRAAGADVHLVLTGATSGPIDGYPSSEDLRALIENEPSDAPKV